MNEKELNEAQTIDNLTKYIAIGSLCLPFERDKKVRLRDGFEAIKKRQLHCRQVLSKTCTGGKLLSKLVSAKKFGCFKSMKELTLLLKQVELKRTVIDYGSKLMKSRLSSIHQLVHSLKLSQKRDFFACLQLSVQKSTVASIRHICSQETRKYFQRISLLKVSSKIERILFQRKCGATVNIHAMARKTLMECKKEAERQAVALAGQLSGCREELIQQQSLNVAIRTEFSNIQANHATKDLEIQKNHAKIKTLESEYNSVILQAKQQADRYEQHIRELKASAARETERERKEKEKAIADLQKCKQENEDIRSALEAEKATTGSLKETQYTLENRNYELEKDLSELIHRSEQQKRELETATAQRKGLAEKLTQITGQREEEKSWMAGVCRFGVMQWRR